MDLKNDLFESISPYLTSKERAFIEGLNDNERELTLQTLSSYLGSDSDSPRAVNELWSTDYKYPPVTIDTFLDDPYYLGNIGSSLWPKWREYARKIFDPYEPANEVILTGSIGCGKTSFAVCILAYCLYRLTCMINPQAFHGLAPNSLVVFMFMSTTKDSVGKASFYKINAALRNSPYFKEKVEWSSGPPGRRSIGTILFNNSIMVADGSQEGHALSLDTYGAFLDEINFRRGDKKKNVKQTETEAYSLFNAIRRRMESRFRDGQKIPGLLVTASSETTEKSFTSQRVSRVKNQPGILVVQSALYDMKPMNLSGVKFDVYLGDRTQHPRILDDTNHGIDRSRIIEVPVEFRQSFEDDIFLAIRDIAGRPTSAINPLISNEKSFWACIKEDRDEHPFQDYIISTGLNTPGKEYPRLREFFKPEKLFVSKDAAGKNYRLINRPGASRWIHVDLSKNNDRTGIACVHIVDNIKTTYELPNGNEAHRTDPIYEVDFMVGIQAPPGTEIDYTDIISFITYLSNCGMHIAGVSYDGYQSTHSIQVLSEDGYDAHVISLDRSPLPYLYLKQCIIEERIRAYRHPLFCEEMLSLEHDVDIERVDHPVNGSKDISDAVCGAVNNAFMSKFPQQDLATLLESKTISVAKKGLDRLKSVGKDGKPRRPEKIF